MAYLRARTSYRKIEPSRIDAWRKITTGTASDCMNRGQAMAAAIKPLKLGMRICGQARTVQCMYADNSILHYANSTAEPGEVLVADVGGVVDAAVWGGVTALEAKLRKLGGLVVDGAVRDLSEILSSEVPVFCRGVVPRGPHKAFGGSLDTPIACGGLAVHSGDLILGDDDGVVVVPLDREEAVFQVAVNHRKSEDHWFKVLGGSVPFYKVINVPEPEYSDGATIAQGVVDQRKQGVSR